MSRFIEKFYGLRLKQVNIIGIFVLSGILLGSALSLTFGPSKSYETVSIIRVGKTWLDDSKGSFIELPESVVKRINFGFSLFKLEIPLDAVVSATVLDGHELVMIRVSSMSEESARKNSDLITDAIVNQHRSKSLAIVSTLEEEKKLLISDGLHRVSSTIIERELLAKTVAIDRSNKSQTERLWTHFSEKRTYSSRVLGISVLLVLAFVCIGTYVAGLRGNPRKPDRDAV